MNLSIGPSPGGFSICRVNASAPKSIPQVTAGVDAAVGLTRCRRRPEPPPPERPPPNHAEAAAARRPEDREVPDEADVEMNVLGGGVSTPEVSSQKKPPSPQLGPTRRSAGGERRAEHTAAAAATACSKVSGHFSATPGDGQGQMARKCVGAQTGPLPPPRWRDTRESPAVGGVALPRRSGTPSGAREPTLIASGASK